MGRQEIRTKAMRAQRVHISLLPLATLVAPILGQLQFNGGVSSSSNSNSNSANRNTNRPTSGDVDEKFFLGGDSPSLTGNQALDGGIVGLGLGALGAAVLGPTIQGALNGAQQSQGFNSCGRRKRQANFGGSTSPGGAGAGGQDLDGEERFFLPTGQGFNQNQGFNNQNNRVCQCDYSLTFRDQNGNTHGACQRRDNTGRTWCYTTGWSNNCGDLQTSKRYPNNPWSYTACSNQGR